MSRNFAVFLLGREWMGHNDLDSDKVGLDRNSPGTVRPSPLAVRHTMAPMAIRWLDRAGW
ncbi:MAG: hypothetical protein NZ820_03095 [Dehalococcoidia bacterium]|nr:hypothetical protein [Dehalococcoidia bacterium]